MEGVGEMTLHELVHQAAALYADRRAVCFDGCSNQPPRFYTYLEVVDLAKQLTHFLKKHCDPEKNCEIGLYCYPGINLASWILGILQVPAAYSPVDPDAPPNVSSYFIKRCNLKYILVQSDHVQKFKVSFSSLFHENDFALSPLGVTLFKMKLNSHSGSLLDEATERNGNTRVKSNFENNQTDSLKHSEETQLKESLAIRQKHCLAYVLHTSGTTGIPKIVRVPHKCIVPNIHHLRSVFNITEDDLLFLASPLTFDPSVVELFAALTSGACLLMVPNAIKMMPRKLSDTLFHHHKVTVLQATPTLLRRFGMQHIRSTVMSDNTSLRVLALGGEPFPALSVFKNWREGGNKTHIYNLYGVTEVSCWATCYRIPEEVLSSPLRQESSVPLGIPLLGTLLEVRDSNGCVVQEGEGQLFLGGEDRVCFLDDETSVPLGTMRQTGDWVTVKDASIFYLGRKDNQIKHHGKRLSLESVQQVVEGFCQVETCAVTWFQEEKLVLFVVSRISIDKRNLSSELQKHLSSHAIPDDVLVIEALPLTSHGKIDTSELNKMYQNHLNTRIFGSRLHTEEELWDTLDFIWKSLLGTSDVSASIPKDSVFLYCGGDSLKSLRFQEEIEKMVGKPVPGLLEVIINDTISDIYAHVSKALFRNEEQISSSISRTRKRKLSGIDSESFIGESAKQNRPQELSVDGKEMTGFIALSRGNLVYSNSPLLSESVSGIGLARSELGHQLSDPLISSYSTNEGEITKISQKITRTPTGSSDVTVDVKQAFKEHGSRTAGCLELNMRWKSDTGKCVDASPLAVISAIDDSSGTVYIGSHSHRMQALDLSSGTVQWERLLGDRIESSACVSKCGKFIIVGCYNGIVYVLKRHNGETYWTFTTENAVKSSATVDPSTGFVFIGSHDQHTYALNIDLKECVWKQHCGGGAIFSSPCLSIQPHHLYATTLGGLLLALNPDTGSIVWKTSCGKPLFSSPRCSQEYVFIGCVDDSVYCFSHRGEKIWQFSTNGPVFSTPCISSLTGQEIFFGSHDGYIYCCNMVGNLQWKFKASAKVYATPFVFCAHDGGSESLVAAASTDGALWILAADSGLLRFSYTFPGEVFSSPLVWGTKLVVGCRNDYVYCLDVCTADRKITDH